MEHKLEVRARRIPRKTMPLNAEVFRARFCARFHCRSHSERKSKNVFIPFVASAHPPSCSFPVLFPSLVFLVFCGFLNKTRVWPSFQLCSACSAPGHIDDAGCDIPPYFQEKVCSVNYAILDFTLLLFLQY